MSLPPIESHRQPNINLSDSEEVSERSSRRNLHDLDESAIENENNNESIDMKSKLNNSQVPLKQIKNGNNVRNAELNPNQFYSTQMINIYNIYPVSASNSSSKNPSDNESSIHPSSN